MFTVTQNQLDAIMIDGFNRTWRDLGIEEADLIEESDEFETEEDGEDCD